MDDPELYDDRVIKVLATAFRAAHASSCYPDATAQDCDIAAKRMIQALWHADFLVVREPA